MADVGGTHASYGREPVDLVVNCFERTYRTVLGSGYFAARQADHVRPFARRIALVNNVGDRANAEQLADERIAAGGLDAVFFVADHVDAALAQTGLTREDLMPVAYFLDFALVAACLPGPDLMVVNDADVGLEAPFDWITPSLELMAQDPRVMIANPNWEDATLEASTVEHSGPFALGPGFSDQLYLGRRAELGAPIYTQRCLATLRYPLSHVARIYEARVDAYLRHHGRLRATHTGVRYLHPVEMGTSWPAQSTRQRARGLAHRVAFEALLRTPPRLRAPHLRQL